MGNHTYMDTLIRLAQYEDAPSVLRLVHELASFDHEECTLDLAYVLSYLEKPGTNILIAQEDQEVVGLVSFWIRPNLYHAGMVCLIEEFIVESSYRSQGVGSKLLMEVIRRTREIGCAEISVSTMTNNEAAVQFYRRHGLIDESLLLEQHF